MDTAVADLPPKAAEFARILQEHMPELEREYGVASLALVRLLRPWRRARRQRPRCAGGSQPTDGYAEIHRAGRSPFSACGQACGPDNHSKRVGTQERKTLIAGGRSAVTRPVIEFLRDIMDWMEHAQSFVVDIDRREFVDDLKTRSAVERAVEIIGEASKHIPDDIRRQFPDVPWQSMAGMRDRVSHAYFGIDYDVLWQTVTEEIPPLLQRLKEIVAFLEKGRE